MPNPVGRKRLPYLRADYKISLPATLVAEVDLLLEDPLTRKPKYGARSKLVEGLLKDWLSRTTGCAAAEAAPTLNELRGSA